MTSSAMQTTLISKSLLRWIAKRPLFFFIYGWILSGGIAVHDEKKIIFFRIFYENFKRKEFDDKRRGERRA